MYIIRVMIFTCSIRDFGHPKFLKSQVGHTVMKILAKSQLGGLQKYFHYVYKIECMRPSAVTRSYTAKQRSFICGHK